jgi:hypothetical protein
MPVEDYVKKPVLVQAIRFDGHNDAEIAEFVGDSGWDPDDPYPSWAIQTLHGPVEALTGDWIIKGAQGDFWPCKPDVFEDSYGLALQGDTTVADLAGQLIFKGLEAFRITRDYVNVGGVEILPAVPGWAWYDWATEAEDYLYG